MSAFASVITPFDASPAIELGNQWRKRILPVGEISYQGRTLRFSREYLQGLVRAWQDRAYDQVPFQLADASNTHSNDPERTRGWITDMQLADDGLYVTAELTPRGQRVLSENPYLGCSARIVEQFQRADGKFYPAAVQHVLGTLDPRIPALGPWTEVQLANESSVVIDLSSYAFSGEPAPVTADPFDALTDAELDQFIDAISEVEEEAGMPYDDPGYASAAQEFDAAFSQRAAADAAREAARFEFEQMDLIRPARRAEDRMARIMAKAGAGLYSGQEYGFSAEAGAGRSCWPTAATARAGRPTTSAGAAPGSMILSAATPRASIGWRQHRPPPPARRH